MPSSELTGLRRCAPMGPLIPASITVGSSASLACRSGHSVRVPTCCTSRAFSVRYAGTRSLSRRTAGRASGEMMTGHPHTASGGEPDGDIGTRRPRSAARLPISWSDLSPLAARSRAVRIAAVWCGVLPRGATPRATGAWALCPMHSPLRGASLAPSSSGHKKLSVRHPRSKRTRARHRRPDRFVQCARRRVRNSVRAVYRIVPPRPLRSPSPGIDPAGSATPNRSVGRPMAVAAESGVTGSSVRGQWRGGVYS